MTNEPGIINDNYNSCIQCDEDKSGTVFKYFAGRNRRNSGIISEIHRSIDKVYDVDQCYYWYFYLFQNIFSFFKFNNHSILLN